MVVCHCLALNDRTIRELGAGARGPRRVLGRRRGGPADRCGGCRPTIEALLAEHQGLATPVELVGAGSAARVASAA